MPVATPIAVSEADLAEVRYNADGLIPAIVQEQATGAVLMMAWMTADTLRKTLESGRTVFWSRSRKEEWAKGDTSGDRQWIREAYYDCDGDTLLFVVEQEGKGACHTGERSCFFRAFAAPPGGPRDARDARSAAPVTHRVRRAGLRLPRWSGVSQ